MHAFILSRLLPLTVKLGDLASPGKESWCFNVGDLACPAKLRVTL